MTASEAEADFRDRVLQLADLAFSRVITGPPTSPVAPPLDLEPADAVRWAGDRVTELLAGFAELPLDRMLGLDAQRIGESDHDQSPGTAGRTPAGVPLTITASCGAVAEARVWVHVVGAVRATTMSFTMTDLVDGFGDPLPGDSAVFEPAALTLPAPVGASTVLRFRIPDDAPAGSYHGHVLGRGVPGAVVPITAVVR
jgi:hypothetical protein